jgi:hypothetical protein
MDRWNRWTSRTPSRSEIVDGLRLTEYLEEHGLYFGSERLEEAPVSCACGRRIDTRGLPHNTLLVLTYLGMQRGDVVAAASRIARGQ